MAQARLKPRSLELQGHTLVTEYSLFETFPLHGGFKDVTGDPEDKSHPRAVTLKSMR